MLSQSNYMCKIKGCMYEKWDETSEMHSILLSPDHDCRVRSVQSVTSRSLLALWLPCVTHGSSMLHSLLPSVCLFPSLSQPHSLPSSCFPLSFPQALVLPPSFSLALPYFPTWYLVYAFLPILQEWTASAFFLSLGYFFFYMLMASTLSWHMLRLILGQRVLAAETKTSTIS